MLTELALKLPGGENLKPPGNIPSGGLSTKGGDALRTGLGVAMIGAVLVCLIFIVWGGLAWISSGGDKQKLAAARARIMYAIVGLVLVLLSFMIVNLFTGFLGLPSVL